MKKIIGVVLLICCQVAAWSQITIEGTVRDAVTDIPLNLVNISQLNTNNGTISDGEGAFSLIIFDTTKKELRFDLVGYESQTVTIDWTQNFYAIYLQETTVNIPTVTFVAPPFSEKGKLLNLAAPVTILNRQKLEQNDGFSFAPVLNQVPGVVMQSGAFNTNRISIRGIGSRSLFSTTKLRAYLNEIPLTTGDGETTIEDFDLGIINQIEVTKGPNETRYGAALGGTVRLNTYNLYNFQSAVKGQVQVGSFGLLNGITEANLRLNNGWISLRYNNLHTDGYRENSTVDRENFTLLSKLQLSYTKNLGEIYVLANYTKLKAFIPSSIDSATFENNPQAAAFNWASVQGFEDYDKGFFGLNHKINFWKSNWTLNSSLFSSFRNAYEVRPFNILTEANQTYGTRISAERQKFFENEASFTFKTGGEVFLENYSWQTELDGGSQLSDNIETRFYYNIFTEGTFVKKNFRLIGGINFNDTRYELKDLFTQDTIDQSGNYRFTPVLSPRLGVVYEFLTPKNIGEVTVYANASHGFSPPSLSETLTPEGLINPDIQPEKGWNFEIGSRGYLWRYQQKESVYHIFYDLSLYSLQVRDLLVAQRTAEDAFIGVNAGQTQHNGLEVLVNYKPFIQKKYNLEVNLAYSFTDYRFLDFINQEEDYSGNQLTGIPSNTVNILLLADYEFSTNFKIVGNFNYQFTDEMPMRDDNSIYSEAFQVANLKLGVEWIKGRLNFNLYGGVNNLFDEAYAAMILVNASSFGGRPPRYYYPGLPQHYYAGLSLTYLFGAL